MRISCLLPAIVAGLLPLAAQAAVPSIEPEIPDQLSDEQMAEIVDFIVGNAVFALYHQAGHMMALRYGLGPDDEDQADLFAAITLLEPRSGPGDQTLVDAIDSFRLAAHQQGGKPDLPDVHSVDGARADTLACDMVGSDPTGFSDVADAMGILPEARQACAGKWRRATAHQRATLRTLIRPEGKSGPPLPVIYDPPLDRDIAEATILKDNGVLEEVATRLGATYDFAAAPTLRATHCDTPTSRFDAEHNELVLCYELSAYHGQLILADIEGRG